MARGDTVIFDEALAKMLSGNWASIDEFYCGICDDTTTPIAAFATPVYTDFTEVGTGGIYVAGGLTLGALSTLVSEAAGVMKFDSATNPTWAQDANNDVDAYWAIVYNYTDAQKDCLCFVDLGGPVDMSGGALIVTWNVSGLLTISS